MRILNQIIPMFLLVQFLVVFAGLAAAMLSTSMEASLPSRRLAHGLGFVVSISVRMVRVFCRPRA